MRARTTISAAIGIAVLSILGLPPSSASAGPNSPTSTAVAIGDSFASGEGGRWLGNSPNTAKTRDGTDRAAACSKAGCTYDGHRVYGSSFDNGCDRSDVAPIKSSGLFESRVNLACSGASTVNLFRATQGGQAFKGEASQADQLATIARQRNVKLIVLTIGANDVKFTDQVTRCVLAFALSRPPCNPAEQASLSAALPAARAGLAKAIDELRATMASSGYGISQYRLVVAGYASPIPRGADFRYAETGGARISTGGCPFWSTDADWAKNTAAPSIVDAMRSASAAKGAQFLDLRDAFNGHEVCNRSARLVDSTLAPSGARHEWVRWLVGNCCGTLRESFHPNAFGQKAIGKCVALIQAKPRSGNWTCRNTPGSGAGAMKLQAIG